MVGNIRTPLTWILPFSTYQSLYAVSTFWGGHKGPKCPDVSISNSAPHPAIPYSYKYHPPQPTAPPILPSSSGVQSAGCRPCAPMPSTKSAKLQVAWSLAGAGSGRPRGGVLLGDVYMDETAATFRVRWLKKNKCWISA